MPEQRWPLRVRFAHWVLGLISPWLELTPVDEDACSDDEQGELDAAYEAGMQQGYELAREDFGREELPF